MDTIFEISTLENPRVPNFIKIGQLLVFGHFLGAPPPKKHKFFGQKMFGPKFWPHIRIQHIRKPLYTKFQQNRMTFENWLKSA